MKRRTFLKSIGMAGAVVLIPATGLSVAEDLYRRRMLTYAHVKNRLMTIDEVADEAVRILQKHRFN